MKQFKPNSNDINVYIQMLNGHANVNIIIVLINNIFYHKKSYGNIIHDMIMTIKFSTLKYKLN